MAQFMGTWSVTIASYLLSSTQSLTNERLAYVSTFTRAGELALGALVALGEPLFRRMPKDIAAVMTWTGLGAILYASHSFPTIYDYPGREVAIPVLGAAAIIAGGVIAPRFGAEFILGKSPIGWLGKRSYSLYLWHTPVIIIGTLYLGGGSTSWHSKIALAGLAMLLTIASFRYIETPIRNIQLSPKGSVSMGVCMIGFTLAFLTMMILLNP